MTDLIREYLPTSPDDGLYVVPDIPEKKLRAAVRDYGEGVLPADVAALYDATRLGSAKDGALFLADRLVFQNTNLQAPRTVRYADIVRVERNKKLFGGVAVEMDVNEGRATVTHTLDFSGRPGAAEYVERFLDQAVLRAAGATSSRDVDRTTDRAVVVASLNDLRAAGVLSDRDYRAMLRVVEA